MVKIPAVVIRYTNLLVLSGDVNTQLLCNYLRAWRPSALVSYARSYYIDNSSQVRITINRNISVPQIFSQHQFQTAEKEAVDILRSNPVNLSRHSKYLFGIFAGV